MRRGARAAIARDSCVDEWCLTMWVKVCGMTDESAVAAALAAGADAIGFVFARRRVASLRLRARQLAQPARGKRRCRRCFCSLR
jgi:hypothetical protein